MPTYARPWLYATVSPEANPSGKVHTIDDIRKITGISMIVDMGKEIKWNSRKKLLEQLKKGDEVVTIGGIFGTVVETDNEQNSVTLEVAKNIRIRFLKSAIANVINKS